MRSLCLIAAVFLSWIPDVHACDWDYCGYPAFTLPADGGSIPANAPGFYWTPLKLPADTGPDDVDMQYNPWTDSGAHLPIEVTLSQHEHGWLARETYLIQPAVELTPGDHIGMYTPNLESNCDGSNAVHTRVSFNVEEEAALPSNLGNLNITSTHQDDLVVANDGSCSRVGPAVYLDIAVALSEEASPWRDLLVYETLVDGQPWWPAEFSGRISPTGESWQGRGNDRVFALCDDYSYAEHAYLEPGVYSIQMTAFVPGTDTLLQTNVLEIEFDCELGVTLLADHPAEDSNSYCSLLPEEQEGCATSGTTSGASLLLTTIVLLVLRRKRTRSNFAQPA